MANASHQSKQKQQTLKKESQTSSEPATNGHSQQGDMPWSEKDKVYLSVEQAELAKQLLAASNEAQNQVQFFLVAAGISGQDVIGGDLDADKPYFLVKDPE
tara:strand:- start:203 stop:505 length:303 start_codon:yes stop_codon:yes gene_type:complete